MKLRSGPSANMRRRFRRILRSEIVFTGYKEETLYVERDVWRFLHEKHRSMQ